MNKKRIRLKKNKYKKSEKLMKDKKRIENDFIVEYKPKTENYEENCNITFNDGREYPIGSDVYRAMKHHFNSRFNSEVLIDIKTTVQCRTRGCAFCKGILEKWEKKNIKKVKK